jgi:hypothetical protein
MGDFPHSFVGQEWLEWQIGYWLMGTTTQAAKKGVD